MAFETPWFLKSKTTDVGRANQIVEEKLQRSVTELEFKARKNIRKINNRIDTVKREFKNLTEDVNYETDLDKYGRPLDPDVSRSKSSGDVRPTRKQNKFLLHPKGSKSAHAGHKIKTKPRHKVTTQDIIDKLARMKEREMMTDWTITPHVKGSKKVHKLKPIEGRVNDVPDEVNDDLLVTKEAEINGYDDVFDNDLVHDKVCVDDLHVIKSVSQANLSVGTAETETKVKKKQRKRKTEYFPSLS